jgi:CDP-diacylglycerol--glycerol-3-phosphate 3-phosphatidyltransferase
MSRRLLNLPNVLTLARIGAIPLVVVCYNLPTAWGRPAAAALFLVSSLTDWLDGYLARRLGQTSPFGRVLDPVADKLIVAAALVLLVQGHPHSYMAVPAIVIVGREITVSALREWMAEIGERAQVAVSSIGKTKTTLQMIAISLLLYEHKLYGLPVYELGVACFYVAAALTLWSMVMYLKAAWPSLRKA